MAISIDTLMGEDLDLGTGNTSKPFQGGGTLPGHQVSLSTFSLSGAAGEATVVDLSATTVDLANGGAASFTVTVHGADPSIHDKAMVSMTGHLAVRLMIDARVTAADTVTVTVMNLSGTGIVFSAGIV